MDKQQCPALSLQAPAAPAEATTTVMTTATTSTMRTDEQRAADKCSYWISQRAWWGHWASTHQLRSESTHLDFMQSLADEAAQELLAVASFATKCTTTATAPQAAPEDAKTSEKHNGSS